MTVRGLQQLNTRHATGLYERGTECLEALVLEHLQLVRELRALSMRERTVARLTAEGYSAAEVARRLRVDRRTVLRLLRQLPWHGSHA